MKVMKKLILALFLVCLAASFAMADNIVNVDGLIIEIVPDGATDWDSRDLFPGGIVMDYVIFYPSAANDIIKLRERSATGPGIIKGKDILGGGLIISPQGGVLHPYLKATDCTINTPANASIIIKMR